MWPDVACSSEHVEDLRNDWDLRPTTEWEGTGLSDLVMRRVYVGNFSGIG